MILVSTEYSYPTQRFTAAHELGHFLLHRGVVMHRDPPIDGLTIRPEILPLEERQANKFAAFYLMPRRRVLEAFEYFFLKVPFVFDEAAAFEYRPYDQESLLKPQGDSLLRFLTLASAGHYRGKYFVPLNEQFQVSVTSMAIRIKELGLIQG